MHEDPAIKAAIEAYGMYVGTTVPIEDFTKVDFADLIPKVVKDGEFTIPAIEAYTGNSQFTQLVVDSLIGLGYKGEDLFSLLSREIVKEIDAEIMADLVAASETPMFEKLVYKKDGLPHKEN